MIYKVCSPHRLVFCSVIIPCDKKMNYVSFVIVTVYRQALWPDGLFISLYILVSLIDYLYLFIIYAFPCQILLLSVILSLHLSKINYRCLFSLNLFLDALEGQQCYPVNVNDLYGQKI